MTFTQLNILVMVAELGGFTSAAAKLGVSQSAVSHALKSLEKEWGVVLFSRTQPGIEITDIGQQLLLRAREILALSEAMKQDIAASHGLNRGVLRIGSFGPTSSLKLLPTLLNAYRQQYPGIDVFVDEGEDSEIAQWILERRVDIGFVVLPDERFDTLPLVEDQLVALIPAAHPLAQKNAVSLAELCEMPFIMTAAGSGALIEQLFGRAGLSPRIRYRFSQLLTIIDMVERGEGVSIVAELALPNALTSAPRGFVKLPLKPASKRTVALAVRSLDQATPAMKAFLETGRDLAAEFVR